MDTNTSRQCGYIVASDYVCSDGSVDVADKLQELINNNPHRTIFFPDGTYLLTHTIYTPSHPEKSVDLQLSNFAILKAADSWTGGPLISLGGIEPYNSVFIPGSNYSLTGGILDGNMVAAGISIDGGRETAVRFTSIKNTTIGLYIAWGCNSGSSDADISNINIVGNKQKDSVGIIVESYDNTITNVRIGGVHKGVIMKKGGNILRNVHPLFGTDFEDYNGSIGFLEENGNNIYDYCYGDNFERAFVVTDSHSSIYTNCYAFWWTGRGGVETAFDAKGEFNSMVTNLKIGFSEETTNSVLLCEESTGQGVIQNIFVNESRISNQTFRKYFTGTIFH